MLKGWKTIAAAWALLIVGLLVTEGVEAQIIVTVASVLMLVMRGVTDGFADQLTPAARKAVLMVMVLLQAVIASSVTEYGATDPLAEVAPVDTAEEVQPALDVVVPAIPTADTITAPDVTASTTATDGAQVAPVAPASLSVAPQPGWEAIAVFGLLALLSLGIAIRLPRATTTMMVLTSILLLGCSAAWTAADTQALCRTTAKSIAITMSGVAPNGAKYSKGQADGILEADCSVFKRHKCSKDTPYYVPTACD